MADVANDIRDALGEVFDTLRDDVFFDASDKLFLVKPSTTADAFTDIIEVGKWFFEYDKFRQTMIVSIAASFEDLTESMDDATHIRIESGHDTQVRSDIYRIREADTVPPLGTDFLWKLTCERFETQDGYSILR